MENEVWKAVFQDWGEVLTLGSDKEFDPTGVRSDNKSKKKSDKRGKTVRKTTKKDSEKDQSIQEGIMIDKVWNIWSKLNRNAKIGIIIAAVVIVYWFVK